LADRRAGRRRRKQPRQAQAHACAPEGRAVEGSGPCHARARAREGAFGAGLLANSLSQKRMMGEAMKIDEYVPTMIPIRRTNENPRSTSPPRRNRATTTIQVSPEVIRVRESVWLMLALMT